MQIIIISGLTGRSILSKLCERICTTDALSLHVPCIRENTPADSSTHQIARVCISNKEWLPKCTHKIQINLNTYDQKTSSINKLGMYTLPRMPFEDAIHKLQINLRNYNLHNYIVAVVADVLLYAYLFMQGAR